MISNHYLCLPSTEIQIIVLAQIDVPDRLRCVDISNPTICGRRKSSHYFRSFKCVGAFCRDVRVCVLAAKAFRAMVTTQRPGAFHSRISSLQFSLLFLDEWIVAMVSQLARWGEMVVKYLCFCLFIFDFFFAEGECTVDISMK